MKMYIWSYLGITAMDEVKSVFSECHETFKHEDLELGEYMEYILETPLDCICYYGRCTCCRCGDGNGSNKIDTNNKLYAIFEKVRFIFMKYFSDYESFIRFYGNIPSDDNFTMQKLDDYITEYTNIVIKEIIKKMCDLDDKKLQEHKEKGKNKKCWKMKNHQKDKKPENIADDKKQKDQIYIINMDPIIMQAVRMADIKKYASEKLKDIFEINTEEYKNYDSAVKKYAYDWYKMIHPVICITEIKEYKQNNDDTKLYIDHNGIVRRPLVQPKIYNSKLLEYYLTKKIQKLVETYRRNISMDLDYHINITDVKVEDGELCIGINIDKTDFYMCLGKNGFTKYKISNSSKSSYYMKDLCDYKENSNNKDIGLENLIKINKNNLLNELDTLFNLIKRSDNIYYNYNSYLLDFISNESEFINNLLQNMEIQFKQDKRLTGKIQTRRTQGKICCSLLSTMVKLVFVAVVILGIVKAL